MFIAWYWLVAIGVIVIGYICHMKRYCSAYRQDRDALLEGYRKLRQKRKQGEDEAARSDSL
ncbi:hypothetical protein [Enterobacter sp.]|uniref:hypothetical protein n=1 Tax=Enterobacter sp. TaxID=42895 RepID=UPI00296EE4E9|nr:hypothetical protein [Enterobacter sp.]